MGNTTIHAFNNELEFEKALCEHLCQHGWNEVLMNKTEEELVENWANIIYDNNRGINQLGNYPLTASEMQQILDELESRPSPYDKNIFINGEQVVITRDNADDKVNYGKPVYLKIFDAREICSGQSRYQIVRQPRFRTANALAGERRGDVMLLINGMPVIHIELKRSGVDVTQAAYQIKRYTHEGVFAHGIYSLVQIFVAMTPEKTLYFANPGSEENFAPQYFFHWADFNNNEVFDWRNVATDLLSIPMAHMLVGFYTIADDKDKTLKVLRSYQYFAVNKISDAVHNNRWDDHQHRGGFVWHTTGSGKTMTSFKSAQLIANSGDADKVVFLLDRIELGIQSLEEYRAFANKADSVQDTQDTSMLVAKLLSTSADDKLIVTSIQKMANIKPGSVATQETIKKINQKRLVFIIDECHRNTFGDMLLGIKNTFTRALLFGFTGTPVFQENAHNEITTGTIFGDMLHKYTIGSAVPDGNVLGFDPYMVQTMEEETVRDIAARCCLKTNKIEDIEADEEKKTIYDRFMKELPMEADYLEDGMMKHGVEHYLPKDFYKEDWHHQKVAADIVKSRELLSSNGKFHAMLATKTIPEAIEYYHIFKEKYPSLNVVAVFDNNIDNCDEGIAREDAILEMLDDYSAKYGVRFGLPQYLKYKKDVAKRLAHKMQYAYIDGDHSQQIDLLIVVTQMLTGYDSKWINTLYVDKLMRYVDIIQAFSRTNRLFGPGKPFGTIKYYTMPYTMHQNINDALDVYVDRSYSVFVDRLETNLNRINALYTHIKEVFESFDIKNFERLPESRESRNMFAKDFSALTHALEAAKLQGFTWEKVHYEFQHDDAYKYVDVLIDEETYNVLLQRYRELFERVPNPRVTVEIDYPIDAYIAETGTGTIDAEYLNSKFRQYVRNLYTDGPEGAATKKALEELHKTFATLSQKDQRTALLIIHDLQTGDLRLEVGKSINDYITEYQLREIHGFALMLAEATGLNISQLDNILKSDVNNDNLNEFNRYEELRLTVDGVKVRNFLKKVLGSDVSPRLVTVKFDQILRLFILDGIARVNIIKAYQNDDIVFDQNAMQEQESKAEPTQEKTVQPQVVQMAVDTRPVRENFKSVLQETLHDLRRRLCPVDDIIDGIYSVCDATSIASLDGVGLFVRDAIDNIYSQPTNFVRKMVAFNSLTTKFEAYAKKVYYLIHKSEVKSSKEGSEATLKDVIKAMPCLFNLQTHPETKYRQMYQYLESLKDMRNEEAHISPTATDEELDVAIKKIVSMYAFLTASCINDLHVTHQYSSEEDSDLLMAAEKE
ncbi:MAG: type I restriction endonuclease subunit R [Bacteroidales bacterium]|nr:type I restriction endonuclease subunit R [Bacteroidales bacterium]